MTGRAGLLLDRDGTLIDVVRDEETGAVVTAFHPSHIRLLPGVVEGLREASRLGLALGLATNQPGPAKGQCSREAVLRTNEALLRELLCVGVHIEAVEVCMHHPEGGPLGDPSLVTRCGCRKPRGGMLASLCGRMGLERGRVFAVGDTATDVEAARDAGVSSALLFAAGRCELCPLRGGPSVRADVVGPDLPSIVAQVAARLGLA